MGKTLQAAALFSDWRRLAGSGLNNRAAAARLAVSEAELVASGCGSLSTRLVPDAAAVFEAIRGIGPGKWVVRNDHAVLERPGEVAQVATRPGNVLELSGPRFHLAVSSKATASAFALVEPGERGIKRSLQLFDPNGITVLKVVFRGAALKIAFEAATQALRHPCQRNDEPTKRPSIAQSTPGAATLRPGSLAAFLHQAAALAVPLQITVANTAALLTAGAPIGRVKRSERAPWINVLDPDLELHLHEAKISRLQLEAVSPEGGWLHWYADDGVRAFSVRPERQLHSLAAAASEQTICTGAPIGDKV